MGKICAIDYGMVRIGLAISDINKIIAFPFKTIQNTSSVIKSVLPHLNLDELELIVIGLPLLLNGKDSDMTKQVREFAKELEKQTNIPIVLWDERLTSTYADRCLKEAGMKRKKRNKKTDPIAATLILQSYLDSKND